MKEVMAMDELGSVGFPDRVDNWDEQWQPPFERQTSSGCSPTHSVSVSTAIANFWAGMILAGFMALHNQLKPYSPRLQFQSKGVDFK